MCTDMCMDMVCARAYRRLGHDNHTGVAVVEDIPATDAVDVEAVCSRKDACLDAVSEPVVRIDCSGAPAAHPGSLDSDGICGPAQS